MFAILRRLWEYENGPGQDDLDQVVSRWFPSVGSGSGVSQWVVVEPKLIEHWRQINRHLDGFPVERKERYFAKTNSGWPIHIVKGEWHQPSIIFGSMDYTFEEMHTNFVKLTGAKKGKFLEIEGMPFCPDGYSEYSPKTHPWLYLSLISTDRRNRSHFTKAGKIYQVLMNPSGRKRARGRIVGAGNWIDEGMVHDIVTEQPVIYPPPPVPPSTWFTTIRRTRLRQHPSLNAPKIDPVAKENETFQVFTISGDFGYVGKRGWLHLKDAVQTYPK